jgi:hypothetical protein
VTCDQIKLRGGAVVRIHSTGYRQRKSPPCNFCGSPSSKLCDFLRGGAVPEADDLFAGARPEAAMEEPRRKRSRKRATCDAPICDGCARSWRADFPVQPTGLRTLHRDEFDLCPDHEAVQAAEREVGSGYREMAAVLLSKRMLYVIVQLRSRDEQEKVPASVSLLATRPDETEARWPVRIVARRAQCLHVQRTLQPGDLPMVGPYRVGIDLGGDVRWIRGPVLISEECADGGPR